MKQSLPADAERQQTRQTQPVANPAHSENASSFVDNRPETLAQRKLKETIHASPKMIAQRKLAAAMNNSPRMVAQRKLHAFMNGSTRQLQAAPEEELLLQGKFAPQSPVQREPQSVAKPNNTGLPDNLKSGIEALSGLLELELPPLNGHIMFCLKEKKYDTKLQTCLPTGVSSADGGIGSIRQMPEAIIQGIWLPLHFDTNLVSSSRCTN